MFARVTFSQVSSDEVDEAISIMEKPVLPLMRQQKGFKQYCAFYDRTSLLKRLNLCGSLLKATLEFLFACHRCTQKNR